MELITDCLNEESSLLKGFNIVIGSIKCLDSFCEEVNELLMISLNLSLGFCKC